VVERYNKSEAGSEAGSEAVSIRSYESNARERVAARREKESDWDSSTQVGDRARLNEED
jgi:hypothetical protein